MRSLFTRRQWFLGAAAAPIVSKIFLGDNPVRVVTESGAQSGLTYVHLHENETTAMQTARRFLTAYGGRLISLQADHSRLISFRESGRKFQFDPNRIFSDEGIERTLRNYGAYSAAAHTRVVGLREAILKEIQSEKRLIVAVHNNEGMSVESYRQGGSFAVSAQSVFIDPSRNIHDFILVLDENAFAHLKGLHFNVVLQNPHADDDGSLSVYCQRRKMPYANVEAGYGNAAAQWEMLQALREWAMR